MLEALDGDTDRGKVYRAIVGSPRSSVTEIAAAAGLNARQVQESLHVLSADGIVVAVGPDESVWEAQSPAELTERLLRRDADRRAGLRRAGNELEDLFRFARRERGRYGALEVVDDPAKIAVTMQQLQLHARREIRVIDRPPYVAAPEYYVNQEQLQRERMSAGIVYRTIYFEAAFADPLVPDLEAMVRAGEQARTLADPPMKLVLADDDLAVVSVEDEGHDGLVALLVRPSGLFTALAHTFETLWKLAVPVSTAGEDILDDDRDRQILVLMASGATDDAIARRLGLSRRTVVRRVAELLTRLGASNRFQAGVQASRRGWL